MKMQEKIIGYGAEAKIILNGDLIIKDRIKKSYRLKEIDERIRKQRTRAEKKLLEQASRIINAPNPFPLEEFNKIKMPFIEGKKLSENLNSFPLAKQEEICKTIGEEIAKLHAKDIIHGDLTTSNMILAEDKTNASKQKRGDNLSSSFKIYFIDFGLGYISIKIEDKAVDLHLLKQALEAKHFNDWEILFNEVLKGYKNYKEADKVFERLKAIEKRGRYRS
jgi:TP53 regulating kinase and related kinases